MPLSPFLKTVNSYKYGLTASGNGAAGFSASAGGPHRQCYRKVLTAPTSLIPQGCLLGLVLSGACGAPRRTYVFFRNVALTGCCAQATHSGLLGNPTGKPVGISESGKFAYGELFLHHK